MRCKLQVTMDEWTHLNASRANHSSPVAFPAPLAACTLCLRKSAIPSYASLPWYRSAPDDEPELKKSSDGTFSTPYSAATPAPIL